MEDKMGMELNTYGEKRNACRILVGKLREKRSLGRPKCRWVEDEVVSIE
jgi:hypothetical protein